MGEFRAQSFPVTTPPWFGDLNLTVSGAHFGVVTPRRANDPRAVKLALRQA
ncbi:MAG: hypothetical protein JNL98_05210 [Bryobacterales bacterium]|nr:hypothetical protein [Bryobacterales bacterium]